MPHSLPAHILTFCSPRKRSLASLLVLIGLTTCLPGCGDSTAKQQAAAAQDDPEGEFEWGIERLGRAVREFRPGSSDGISVSDSKIDHELFPPTDETPHYTARVTVTSETSFIHGKRPLKSDKEEKEPEKQEAELLDPLADKSDELNKLLDLPDVGPRAAAAPARIETRVVENKTVFELAYLGGQWQLTKDPEFKYEKMWFEYAFE